MTASVFISTEAIETGRTYWWLRLDYAWHHARHHRAEVTLPDQAPAVLDWGNVDSLRQLKALLRRTEARAREAAVDSIESQLKAKLEDPTTQYPYASIMTWADARKLVSAGFDVGSHTVSHPNLALLSTEEARRELSASKTAIERETQTACAHFCYPYGSFSAATEAAVRESGYAAATSTIGPGLNRVGESLFALRRYAMPADPWKLGYILSGFPRLFSSSPSISGVRQERVALPEAGAPELL